MFKTIQRIPYWFLIAVPLLALFLGAASNQLVLIANGGRFPVLANQEQLAKMCVSDTPAPESIFTQPAPVDLNSCANGGEFMDDVHVVMTSRTHLNFLADIFNLGNIYSIGDFLLMAGDWAWKWAGLAWLVLVIRRFLE